MDRHFDLPAAALAALLVVLPILPGCSSTALQPEPGTATPPGTDQALDHYIQGMMHEQKGDLAKAILEYQDALAYRKDPAIYHSIARDYSALGKHELAIQNGRTAVSLRPESRAYRETLAEVYVNALDLDGALREYEALVRIDSGYINAWFNVARLQQLRAPKEAVRTYETILARFGPDPNIYFQLAQIYGALEQPAKAAGALRGLLQLDPGNFDIQKSLGDLCLQQDSVDAALDIYMDLANRRPENLELRASIAHAYLIKQDYANATAQFELVMKKDSLSVDEQIGFGQVFITFLQQDSAVAPYALTLFEKIREHSPQDWRPYWFLGAIHNIMRNDSAALVAYEELRTRARENPDGWVGVASVHYDRGRFDDAIRVLEEAKKFTPEEFRVYFLLGISYQRKGNNTEAASELEKAIVLNDKSVDAMTALALVYDELKHTVESDSMYERVLRLAPRNHLALNNYAYSLAVRGLQLDRAMRMAQEALSQQPQNDSYMDTMGWIYFRRGEFEAAEKWVRSAVEVGSPSAVVLDHLGDIYHSLGDEERAASYWRKALELDSANQALQEKIRLGHP